MIRLRAGRGRHGLGHIQPVHAVGRFVDAAARGELARVAQVARAGRQKIRVQRDHNVGVREIVIRVGGLAEGLRRAGARHVRSRGIPLVPLGQRIDLLDRAQLRSHGRRGHGLREDAYARAVLRLLQRQRFPQFAGESAPGADLAVESQCLRAIRIVELQHRSLREGVAGAQRRRMLGVALHLGRPAHVTFRKQTVGHAVHRHRGCEEQRAPRNQVFRLANIRHDVLGRLPGAGRHARQCQRRAHHLEEIAATFIGVFIVAPAYSLAREFPLQQILKFRRGSQVVQAAPVIAPASAFQPLLYSGQVQLVPWITHRWQVEQLVRVRAS